MVNLDFVFNGEIIDQRTWPVVPRVGECIDIGKKVPFRVQRVTYDATGISPLYVRLHLTEVFSS